MARIIPNVLITGTPGVGKSTFSRKLAQKTDLQWLDVSTFAESNGFVTGDPDPVYHSRILDEDRLLDALDEKIVEGGFIVDHHSSDLFPIRWFDLVVVLVVGNTVLYDRLSARGYTGKKLDDNVECEIFQTVLEDVRESFSNNIIRVLTNATPEDMRQNLLTVAAAITEWVAITPSNSTTEAAIEMPFVETTEADISEADMPEPEKQQADVPDDENAEEENADEENAEEGNAEEEMEDSDASDYEETDSSEDESQEPEVVVELLPRPLTPGPQVAGLQAPELQQAPEAQVPRAESPVVEVSESESSEELSDSDGPEPEGSDADDDVHEVLETEG